jgi:hypothetical protein
VNCACPPWLLLSSFLFSQLISSFDCVSVLPLLFALPRLFLLLFFFLSLSDCCPSACVRLSSSAVACLLLSTPPLPTLLSSVISLLCWLLLGLSRPLLFALAHVLLDVRRAPRSLNRWNLSAKSSAASIDLFSRALRCSEGSVRRQTTPLCRVLEQ